MSLVTEAFRRELGTDSLVRPCHKRGSLDFGPEWQQEGTNSCELSSALQMSTHTYRATLNQYIKMQLHFFC